MKTIDIVPKIHQDMFMARLVMSDYSVDKPMSISVTARRDDGTFRTERMIYPDPNAGDQDVRMVFFGMTRSCVAQIMSVTIDNAEIRPYYTQLSDSGIYARFDDSLTSLDESIDIVEPNLDFHVYSDGNPKKLIVVDESEWGRLRDEVSMINITVPGFSNPVNYYLGKNKVNIFNSVNLGMSCVTPGEPLCFNDLPDGIYDIEIFAGTFSCSKKYLKTDLLNLEIDKLYSRTCLECDVLSGDIMEKVMEAEVLIRGAEAETRLGNFESAHMLIDRVHELVELMSNCKTCK